MQLVRVAQHDDGQLVQFNLEDRQVGVGVGANHFGPGFAGVVQDDLDFVRAFNDVVVGQDVAAAAHNHATAQPGLCFTRPLVAKEKPEPRVIHLRILDGGLAGVDAHDGGRGDFCRRRETAYRAGCADSAWQGVGRGFDDGNTAQRDSFVQPLRLERGHHEISRHQNGDGLGKQEPGALHGSKIRLAGVKQGQTGAAMCVSKR